MSHILEFFVLGLGPGALIAGIALAVVLTYRGSGAINIATGTVAVLGAFVFYGLKTYGFLFLPPIPFAPHRIQLGGPWATGPAMLVAVAVCAVTGVLIELLVWRPLRRSAPLAKLLASLGVFIVIQSVIVLRFGTEGQLAPPVFPGLANGSVHIFGAIVPPDRLVLCGIVIATAGALAASYRFTRFGLSTRAAQENETNAMLAGLAPQRLSMINTVLAAVVAGALGVLAASQTQLDPVTIPLAVIPALGAALLARFTSFGIAAAAGLLLGVLESEITYLQSLHWFPTDLANQPLPGVSDFVFFLIIVIALLWRGRSLPTRGALVERRLPRAPMPTKLARPAVACGAVVGVALLVLPFDFRQALINSLIGIIICLSLVVITGFVGQVSLLQVGLAGISGFVISKLATGAGVGFPVGMIAGVLAAVVFGTIAALPALRVRGVNLAILTLAAAQALNTFWFEDARWGGGLSTLNVPSPHLIGLNLGVAAAFPINAADVPTPVFGLVCGLFAILSGLLVASVRRSNLGARMLAVRSNESAAAAAGISVRNVKLGAFALSSMLAGIAGALDAYNFGSVSADSFNVLLAFSFIAFAYVGGITSVTGAVLAGLGVTEGVFGLILTKWVGIPIEYQLLLSGVFLVAVIVRYPGGLASAPRPDQIARGLLDRYRARAPGGGGGGGDQAPPGSSEILEAVK